MSKLCVFGVMAAAVSFSATLASAQNVTMGPGCGGAQTYQRYSYQPAGTPQVHAPMNQSAINQSQANQGSAIASQSQAVAQPQTYQRYSYQPSVSQPSPYPYSYQPSFRSSGFSSSPRKNLWEYAKGDPRRYRP